MSLKERKMRYRVDEIPNMGQATRYTYFDSIGPALKYALAMAALVFMSLIILIDKKTGRWMVIKNTGGLVPPAKRKWTI